MTSSEGWISLYRQLLNKAIWQCSTVEQKVILITLLLLANHDTKEWEWKGKKFKCKPGQLITSLPSLAEKCGKGITVQNVRSALTKFKKYEFLTDESTGSGRLITIVNWGAYQDAKNKTNRVTNRQVTDHQQTGNRQLTPNNNDNNDNNYNNDNNSVCLGEFENVVLSKEQYENLLNTHSQDFIDKYIEKLSLHMESEGRKYNSHYATIKKWINSDEEKRQAQVEQNKPKDEYGHDINNIRHKFGIAK